MKHRLSRKMQVRLRLRSVVENLTDEVSVHGSGELSDSFDFRRFRRFFFGTCSAPCVDSGSGVLAFVCAVE